MHFFAVMSLKIKLGVVEQSLIAPLKGAANQVAKTTPSFNRLPCPYKTCHFQLIIGECWVGFTAGSFPQFQAEQSTSVAGSYPYL